MADTHWIVDDPILCLDIGSGTQDVLLARPGLEPENWPRFVLPAPQKLVAQRVRALTQLKKPLWLYGHNMGGGFVRALQEHMQAGLRVAAQAQAALALHDDIERVTAMGITLAPHAPQGYVPVCLRDYDPAFWEGLLRQVGLPLPHRVVAAVQDHGVHKDSGNREGRMRLWRGLLGASSYPEDWVYDVVPPALTRLAALQAATGGSVADTGTAALLGALCAPEVADRSHREGITVVNMGNSHIVAALIYKERVFGLYEHHTAERTLETLLRDLHEFRLTWLPDEQVRASKGHGTVFVNVPEEAGGFTPTFVLGPRREILRGHAHCIAPFGDMMLAGCYGLVRACIAAKPSSHTRGL